MKKQPVVVNDGYVLVRKRDVDPRLLRELLGEVSVEDKKDSRQISSSASELNSEVKSPVTSPQKQEIYKIKRNGWRR